MKIIVTQEDIDHGKPADCLGCPLTLAIRRATGNPHARMVVVDVRVSSNPDGVGVYVLVPAEVVTWRQDFDHNRPVQPFEFELGIPAELAPQ